VRSYDWYLLPAHTRAQMLAEHGRMGSEHPQVLANTISAFALGDYEWLLAFEADDLVPIVDLMRDLRAAEARRYTREELPFLTGRRRSLADAVAKLP
jgi:chlorite dismutase